MWIEATNWYPFGSKWAIGHTFMAISFWKKHAERWIYIYIYIHTYIHTHSYSNIHIIYINVYTQYIYICYGRWGHWPLKSATCCWGTTPPMWRAWPWKSWQMLGPAPSRPGRLEKKWLKLGKKLGKTGEICRDYLLILGWKLVKTLLSGCKTLYWCIATRDLAWFALQNLIGPKRNTESLNAKWIIKSANWRIDNVLANKPWQQFSNLAGGSGNWNPIWAEKIRLHLAIQA